MTCPTIPGQSCPRADCLGLHDPGVCDHLARLFAWRKTDAAGRGDGFRPRVDPADSRLRVGLWAPCCEPGGAETWQQQFARSVDPAKVAWAGLVVVSGSVNAALAAAYDGIMPVGRGRPAATRLAASCDVDVIVSWAIDDIPGLLSAIPPGERPMVISVVHAPIESDWGQHYYRQPEGIDRWVAVSELARDAIPAASLKGRPVDVIWNAVDAERLAPKRSRAEVRASWGVPADAPVAGFLQRFTTEKDPLAAVRLAASLPEPWHVVIVGDGPMMADLRQAKADGSLDRLILPGVDLDAGGVLSAFDTLIVPSAYESFGLTIAEGLWAGLPVISARVGIARLVPGLTREIPIGASGEVIAAAVLADAADARGTAERITRARSFARERLNQARFGRAWTDLLCSAALPRPGSIAPAVRDAVLTCPDRGSVLPVSLQPSCGCGELTECREGKGKVPGRVTLRECLDCRAT